MRDTRLLHSIRLKNLLSYGSEGVALDLQPLNVLIGPNASGKSNLLSALSLLAAAPKNLLHPFRKSGPPSDWLWKGQDQPLLRADLGITLPYQGRLGAALRLDYTLVFIVEEYGLKVASETLLGLDLGTLKPKDQSQGLEAEFLLYREGTRLNLLRSSERPAEIDQTQSVLSQIREPTLYPELAYLGDQLSRIVFFRSWHFGQNSQLRGPQRADLPNDFLLEDGSNLGLVLNNLKNRPATKRLLLEKLRLLYEDAEDFETKVEGGTIQIFLHEASNVPVPATRLSDGLLHYLCLLAILCHPNPPPLICIEEPELGLHPDILPTIAELLVEASSRTQLIVTTHSETLVSSLSNQPESVVVCHRGPGGTALRRLEAEKLSEWLERYRLGELWAMGEIGGTRW